MNIVQRMIKMIAPGTLYRNLPFVYYLAFLGVIYIALGHFAEGNMRKIDRLQDNLQEKRWEYMSIHTDLMHAGSRGRISESVASAGLYTPRTSPKELVVESKIEEDSHE